MNDETLQAIRAEIARDKKEHPEHSVAEWGDYVASVKPDKSAQRVIQHDQAVQSTKYFMPRHVVMAAGLATGLILGGKEIVERPNNDNQHPGVVYESVPETIPPEEPIINIPPISEQKEVEIDYEQLAIARAASLKFSQLRINSQTGEPETIREFGGFLADIQGSIYFATIDDALEFDVNTDENVLNEIFISVPVGDNMPFYTAIHTQEFVELSGRDSNSRIRIAPYDFRDAGLLGDKIKAGTITPLELGVNFSGHGRIIDTNDTNEPEVDSDGLTSSSAIKLALRHSGEVAFMSQQDTCDNFINVGDPVISPQKHIRRFEPVVLGIVTEVFAQETDPGSGVCKIQGVASIGSQHTTS